ncbi:hypothetical protein P9112_012949 [Eukaryota sp. TZLM1-RC]
MRRSSSCNLPCKRAAVGPSPISETSSKTNIELKLRSLLTKKAVLPTVASKNNATRPPASFSSSFPTDGEDTTQDPNSLSSQLFSGMPSTTPPVSHYDTLNTLKGKHWSEKNLSEMTPRDWRIVREDFSIRVKGNVPFPIRSWSDLTLSPPLLDTLLSFNFLKPTPIQMQAIPVITNTSNDLVAVAKTGSGKTLSYLCPVINHILNRPPITIQNADIGPFVVILAPTRELAQQIHKEAEKFSSRLNLICSLLIGGQSLEKQCVSLSSGVHLVIATPGRLKDALSRRYLVLSQCDLVVLDECDKMIAMGFFDQVEEILQYIPASNTESFNYDGNQPRFRRTLMFSATFPPSLEEIASSFLREPFYLAVGRVGKVSDTIEQRVIWANGEEEKKREFIKILKQFKGKSIVVFVNTKRTTDLLAKFIRSEGFSSCSVHGSKVQEQRESVMQRFKEGKFEVLVATDLAGRGLDISLIELVINYEMPRFIDDYVHRIGRTGRAGRKGTAISLIGQEDSDLFYDLKKMLQECDQHVPPQLAHHEASNVFCGIGARTSKFFTG